MHADGDTVHLARDDAAPFAPFKAALECPRSISHFRDELGTGQRVSGCLTGSQSAEFEKLLRTRSCGI